MVKTDFPRDGDFAPPTDYADQSPLDTRERKELKKSTSKNLNDLNRELWGDFAKVTVLGTIKTFDKGYGLRIRDDNGDKIGTAYKWEQVRIFGRKKRVADSEGILRNFLKVGVYNSRGKIDEQRSGWVAEDFVEVNPEHINSLIRNLETRIDRQEKPEPVKTEEKKPEPVKPEEKKPEPVKSTTETPGKAPEARSSIDTIQNRDTIGEISRNINITPKEMMEASKPQVWTPLYITDPLAIPGANKLTPKTDATPAKETPSTPIVKPEEKKTETAKTEVKPEVKKPEPVKPEVKKPEPVKPEEKNESTMPPDSNDKWEIKENIWLPVLSERDEKTLERSIGEYTRRHEKNKTNPDTYNRTFPGRFNDHIKFLKDSNIPMDNSYFIDIAPGVGDFHNQAGEIHSDYPAITSWEIAEAFPETQVIAMDLPESVDRLAHAREVINPQIWETLLTRNNVQVLAWDGLKSLQDQLQGAKDMLGNPLKIPRENQTIIIRACNSIDLYYPFSEVKPAIHKMASDFEDQRLILFLGDKILHKEAGKKQFTIIGQISERWFNHNNQTTDHIPADTPAYEIYNEYKSLFKKTNGQETAWETQWWLNVVLTEIENPNPLPSEIYNKLTETQRADYTETQRADLERLSDLATRQYPDEIINKLENRINDQLKLKSENDSIDTMFGGMLYSAYADWVEKHYGTPEKRKEIPFVRLQVLNSTLTEENFEDMKEIKNKNNLVSLELPNLYLDLITSERLKTLLLNSNSIKNITVKNGDRKAVENIESFLGIKITTLNGMEG